MLMEREYAQWESRVLLPAEKKVGVRKLNEIIHLQLGDLKKGKNIDNLEIGDWNTNKTSRMRII